MGLIFNGNKPSKIIYNGVEPALYFNGSKIWPDESPTPIDEVQIGNQIWKTKNLAIDDGQGGISIKTVNYGQGNVVEYYYTWDAAVRVAASIPGWHLASYDDFVTLVDITLDSDTNKLKSTYGWNDGGNGTDDYGFAAFPSGVNGSIGSTVYFWTSNKTSSLGIYYGFNTSSTAFTGRIRVTNYYAVRLVKDAA